MTDDVVALTRELIRAPSVNPPGDERAVIPVLERFLAGVPGVDVRVHAPRPERPSLVAAVGSGPRTLALAAHTDTHPIAGDWTVDPLGADLADGRIHGRGGTDNKGAVAAMAVAFARLAPQLDGARLLLVANADEETGGAEGVATLLPVWGEAPDAAVVAEPSGIDGPWEALWVGARGTTRFVVRTMGTATHASLAGRPGVRSALEALEALLDSMRATLAPLAGARGRLTVVWLRGGEGWGVVPPEAEAGCELRLAPGAEQDAAEAAVRAAFAAAAPDGAAALAFADGGLRWMSPSGQPDDAPIVASARRAWRVALGAEPALGCFPGGTDARLFETVGIPTVIAGPGALVRAHQPDEHVTVDELTTAVALYEAIAADFLDLEHRSRT